MNAPLAFAALLHAMRLSRSWGNRAHRRGWIALTKIGRKNFVLPADLKRFNERASRGEFAVTPSGICARKPREKGGSHA
jgi:hypothetical protein